MMILISFRLRAGPRRFPPATRSSARALSTGRPLPAAAALTNDAVRRAVDAVVGLEDVAALGARDAGALRLEEVVVEASEGGMRLVHRVRSALRQDLAESSAPGGVQ